MSDQPHQRVVDHLYETSGDTLRGVVSYDGDRADPLYVRQGIDGTQFRKRVEYTIARALGGPDGENQDSPPVTGYHVELFDGVVFVYLYEGDSAGTVVSMDSILARNLVSTVRECQRTLTEREREPQATV